MKHKLLFLLIFLALFGSMSGQSAIIDRTVAIVNDDIITLSDIAEFRKKLIENTPSSEELKSENKILDALIEDRLTKQVTKKLNLTATDDEVSTQINGILKSQGINQVQLKDFLKQRGISYKQYRDNIKQGIEQQKLLEREIKSSISIREEDMRAYYYNFIKGKSSKKSYHIRQIFLSAETAEEKKKKMSQAEIVLSLSQKGSSFDELAKQYSPDPSSSDLGFINEEDLNGPFKQVLKTLKPQTLSQPFETHAGIHLIELVEVKSLGEKNYPEAKDEIQKALYEKEFQKILHQWIKTKKEEAYIKILPPITQKTKK